MKEIAKKIMLCLAIILASIYLTFYIDVFTLNTLLKRVFVFFYFCCMCSVVLMIKRKIFSVKSNFFTCICALTISLLLLNVFQNSFLPLQQEIQINLKANESIELVNEKEVWLTDVFIDGKKVILSQLDIEYNNGWLYSSAYDDYVFYPSEATENALILNTVAKDIVLVFAQNTWSGSVEIQLPNYDNSIQFLQLADEYNETITSEWHTTKEYTWAERIIYNSGATVVLSFLCYCLVQLLFVKRQKLFGSLTNDNSAAMLCLFIAYSIITGILFFASGKIVFASVSKIVLILISLAALTIVFLSRNKSYMLKYRNSKTYIILLLISLYSSFAMFGHQLFLQGNMRPDISWINLLYLFAGMLWFMPIIVTSLWLLENLSMSVIVTSETISKLTRKKAAMTLFTVLASCQLIICFSFWPGGFPSDTLDQLNQAVLGAPLNDWHPVLHTLFFRLIYGIYPNPGLIVAVQMLLFALLCTLILMLGYDRGIKLNNLCLFGIAFLLLPNQVISGIGAVKDFPYTLALLWGTYLLLRLVNDFTICKTNWFKICFAIDLFLIYGLRHNGLLPVLFIVILAVYLTLKYYKVTKIWLIGTVIVALLSMGIYKGPIFSTLNVSENTASMYTTMFCAVGSCINKDLPLSEESTAILESVMPLEDWANYYSRFEGHDQYLWGAGKQTTFDLTHIGAREAFSVYIEALLKYPDVIIKDRLDGIDILWDIQQPEDSFNARGFGEIYNFSYTADIFSVDKLKQNIYGNYYNDSTIAELYRDSLNIYYKDLSLLDSLFWRSGIYIILFMVLMIFWHKNQMMKLIWAAVPMLGNITGSLLILYHQSFRYVYFVQVIVIALLFVTICLRNSWDNKNIDLHESERDIL